MSKFAKYIARHWLFSTLFVLTSLVAYTQTPLYGADPTPTPNVSTVPKPDQLFTPTPMSSPVIVIVTREAPPSATDVAPSDAPEDSDQAEPTAQADTATSINGDIPDATGASAEGLPVATSAPPTPLPVSATTSAPAVALSVVATPTLIWQGVVFQLHFVISNQGATSLTHLALRQKLPLALHYVTSTIDSAGSVTLEAHPDGDPLLAMDWPDLAPGVQRTATITLQVAPDTPNGLLLDSRAVVQSSEGATAAIDLTWAMPPAALPQFRK